MGLLVSEFLEPEFEFGLFDIIDEEEDLFEGTAMDFDFSESWMMGLVVIVQKKRNRENPEQEMARFLKILEDLIRERNGGEGFDYKFITASF